jgi:hypothetical protein
MLALPAAEMLVSIKNRAPSVAVWANEPAPLAAEMLFREIKRDEIAHVPPLLV